MEAARRLTNGGDAIDDHQVVVERVAYAATEARVIGDLARAPAELAGIISTIERRDGLAGYSTPTTGALHEPATDFWHTTGADESDPDARIIKLLGARGSRGLWNNVL